VVKCFIVGQATDKSMALTECALDI